MDCPSLLSSMKSIGAAAAASMSWVITQVFCEPGTLDAKEWTATFPFEIETV